MIQSVQLYHALLVSVRSLPFSGRLKHSIRRDFLPIIQHSSTCTWQILEWETGFHHVLTCIAACIIRFLFLFVVPLALFCFVFCVLCKVAYRSSSTPRVVCGVPLCCATLSYELISLRLLVPFLCVFLCLRVCFAAVAVLFFAHRTGGRRATAGTQPTHRG